jgi:hypothetical protein
MSAIMNEREPRIALHWHLFAAKCVLFLVWLIAALAAADTLRPDRERSEALIAALVIVIPPLIWLLLRRRKVKRRDEFQAQIESRALAQGFQFANIWGACMLGANVVLWLADIGAMDVAAIPNYAIKLLVMQPVMAFIISESFAQQLRVRYAKGAGA